MKLLYAKHNTTRFYLQAFFEISAQHKQLTYKITRFDELDIDKTAITRYNIICS